MIYDHVLTAYTLTKAASPLGRQLQNVGQAYYAPRSVWGSRYYAASAAGIRLDTMVELSGWQTAVLVPGGFVRLEDGQLYKIVQIQDEEDTQGSPIILLSLQREDKQYDYLSP